MLHIQENISLKNFNTFHIDVKARFFVEVKSMQDMQELWESWLCNQYPFFLLWGGANILFTKDYPWVIIKVSLTDMMMIREDSEYVYVRAWAGENRHQFVMWCVGQNFWGLENLALIPGTVGASAVGNIGAYGVEVKDLIDEVQYIHVESRKPSKGDTSKVNSQTDFSQNIKTLKNAECKFAYRESIFKHELQWIALITSITFKVKKADKNYTLNLGYKDIQQVIAEKGMNPESLTMKDIPSIIIAIRQSKLNDPLQTWTAGSFFKNPVITEEAYLSLQKQYPTLVGNKVHEWMKLSAGQLIELAGLKGYKQWHVWVSSKHALILINLWDGTGEEMVQLANHILSEVKRNFWITLDPEVIIM